MSPAERMPVDVSARYTRTAMLFHWAIAMAILAAIGMGFYMTSTPMTVLRFRVYNWHKWLGVCVLLAMVLRLAWRIRHAPPPHDAAMTPLQAFAAHAMHSLLYLLCFLAPLSGWAHTSAVGRPVVLFGRFQLPDFVPVDTVLAAFFKTTHHWFVWTLSVLIVLHIAAALKHRLVDRDGVLARMLPPFPFQKSR